MSKVAFYVKNDGPTFTQVWTGADIVIPGNGSITPVAYEGARGALLAHPGVEVYEAAAFVSEVVPDEGSPKAVVESGTNDETKVVSSKVTR